MSEVQYSFNRLRQEVTAGIEKQLHWGLACSISTSNAEYEFACGEREPGDPLKMDDSLFWLSAAKPITAVAILQLYEQGLIDLRMSLLEIFPDWSFAIEDNLPVTIWHLLTHTSPLPEISTGWPDATVEEVYQNIMSAQWKSEWIPGARAAYLPSVSWFLLGRIIELISGLDYEHYIQKHILLPAGMTRTFCTANEAESLRPPRIYDRVMGQLQSSEYQQRANCRSPSPGSSFRGPTQDLRKFYDALKADLLLNQQSLLASSTVEQMVTRQRVGLFDETLQHQVDYGLGVIIDSRQYGSETVPYGFGDRSSSRTFGHGGSQCAIGFVDPQTQLTVVMIANGRPGEGQHQRRFRQYLNALQQDLADIESL